MANLKKAILGIILLVLIIFTALFIGNAYNTGKIGHKAEKIADTFSQDIIGSWTGKYQISGITFMEDGKTSLTMLGVALDGTYSDKYDIETEKHTLTLKYKTVLGLSVERSYFAKLDGDKLKLTDTQLDSVELRYTRSGAADETAEITEKNENAETTVYNPGVEVYSKELLGAWKDSNGTNSGYEFFDDSTVSIKLMGISYEGKYSVSIDEATNKCLLKITYASVAGINVNNSYYVTIADGVLTLSQKGAESISATYVKQ